MLALFREKQYSLELLFKENLESSFSTYIKKYGEEILYEVCVFLQTPATLRTSKLTSRHQSHLRRTVVKL